MERFIAMHKRWIPLMPQRELGMHIRITRLLRLATLACAFTFPSVWAQTLPLAADANSSPRPEVAPTARPRVHIRVPGSSEAPKPKVAQPAGVPSGSKKAATQTGSSDSNAADGAGAATDSLPTKGERKAKRDFDLLDFNGDGYLTRDEVLLFPRLAKEFDQADTNHDNRISFEEVRAFAKRYRAERDRKAKEAADPASVQRYPADLPKRPDSVR